MGIGERFEFEKTGRIEPESKSAPVDGIVIWQCYKCGWRIDDVCYQSARIEYNCPRCRTPYGHFMRKVIKREGTKE